MTTYKLLKNTLTELFLKIKRTLFTLRTLFQSNYGNSMLKRVEALANYEELCGTYADRWDER